MNNLNQHLINMKKRISDGDISLDEELDTIKHLIAGKDPKHAKANIKKFFDLINITYSDNRQIYFSGKQNRKGSGKAVNIREIPIIFKRADHFINNLQ